MARLGRPSVGSRDAVNRRENTTCCYALQDKVWVDDPDQVPWEIYTVLADADAGDDAEAPTGSGKGAQHTPPRSRPTTHCC